MLFVNIFRKTDFGLEKFILKVEARMKFSATKNAKIQKDRLRKLFLFSKLVKEKEK